MCGNCHQGLSDETIIRQTKEALEEDNCAGWNVTSISHMALVSIGVNGKEAQELGLKLLLKYISWKAENPKTGDDTFFGEPSSAKVNEVYQLVLKFNEEHKDNKDIKHFIFNFDNGEYGKLVAPLRECNKF